MGTVVHIPPPEEPRRSASHRLWVSIALGALALGAVTVLVLQTRPPAPAYEWASVSGPPGNVNLDSLVAIDDGFAMLSGITATGVSLWWIGDTGDWASQALEGAPSQLTSGYGRLMAYRVRSGAVLSRDGDGWVSDLEIDFPAETRTRRASGRPGIVITDYGILEMSLFGDVWRSRVDDVFEMVVEDPDWGHGVEQPFTSECRPPSRSSPDVPPLAITDTEHLVLVSSNPDEPFGVWPVCEPDLYTSSDGIEWSPTVTSLGGAGAYVYDMAWRDGMLVAVGGYDIDRPAVWMSGDGVDWIEITPTSDSSVDLFRVEAGPAGWVILGHESLSSEPVGWVSADGSCWESLPDRVGGTEAVITDGAILVVDRTIFPGMWMASPTGGSGVCG